MAEHTPGNMNIDAQEKTFEGFMSFVTRTVVVILLVIVLMAVFLV